MNRIYWDRDKISILTDQIESIEHKHYAIQLFLSIDKPLNLYVSGKLIAGKCVIVNHNVNHVFSTGNKLLVSCKLSLNHYRLKPVGLMCC